MIGAATTMPGPVGALPGLTPDPATGSDPLAGLFAAMVTAVPPPAVTPPDVVPSPTVTTALAGARADGGQAVAGDPGDAGDDAGASSPPVDPLLSLPILGQPILPPPPAAVVPPVPVLSGPVGQGPPAPSAAPIAVADFAPRHGPPVGTGRAGPVDPVPQPRVGIRSPLSATVPDLDEAAPGGVGATLHRTLPVHGAAAAPEAVAVAAAPDIVTASPAAIAAIPLAPVSGAMPGAAGVTAAPLPPASGIMPDQAMAARPSPAAPPAVASDGGHAVPVKIGSVTSERPSPARATTGASPPADPPTPGGAVPPPATFDAPAPAPPVATGEVAGGDEPGAATPAVAAAPAVQPPVGPRVPGGVDPEPGDARAAGAGGAAAEIAAIDAARRPREHAFPPDPAAPPLPHRAAAAAHAVDAPASLPPAASALLAGTAIHRQLDLAHDARWLDQLARDISIAAANDGTMRFQLNPEHLGSLAVEVRQVADGAAIRLTAETDQARQIIADAQPRLLAEARAQGLRIAEAQVDLGAGRQSGQQQPGHQPPPERHPAMRGLPSVLRDAAPAPVTVNTPIAATADRYA